VNIRIWWSLRAAKMLIELVFPDKSVPLARLPCPAANTYFLDDTSKSA